MKLKFEQLIDADLDTVWAAFDKPDNMVRWQQNLESFTPVSGDPGQVGAVAEIVYNENGRKVVLKETVTERREPDLLAGIYEAGNATTLIVNHFEKVGDKQTRWTVWCNFTFRGFMKVASLFFAGAIRKRTEGDMERFKLMVETDQAGGAG